jgi:hypothetical protein
MRNATAGTRQIASWQPSGPDRPIVNLTFAIAESWLSLTAQQEAMDELLVIWSKAQAATSAAPIRLPFQYPCEPRRGRITALQAREAISA